MSDEVMLKKSCMFYMMYFDLKLNLNTQVIKKIL